MISEAAVWVIFLLPVGALAVNALVVRPFLNDRPYIAAVVIVAALGRRWRFRCGRWFR